MSMQGKRVLITGVGAINGIGFACAKAFVEAGAKVVISSLSSRAQERAIELGPETSAFCGDLSDLEFVHQLIEFAVNSMGGIDVVISNAGMTSVLAPMSETGESNSLAEISPTAWQGAIARNLDSVFYLTKAALPELRKSSAGRIVAVASVTGPLMAMRNEAAYAAAKAGVVGLIRSVALDEGKHGITANAVSPGWIATDSQTENEAQQGAATPLGRSGTAAEIAAAVIWLASDAASYITGQNLVIDGGNSIAEERF